MRLKSLAIGLLCGGVSLAPAFAQTALAQTAPATMAPAKPAVPATATPVPMAPMTTAAPKPTTPPATTTAATPAPAATSAAIAPLTNINTASAKDLDKLPLIGKARAASIIKNRPYKSPDELVSKKAISQKVFDKIKDKITTS